MEVLRQNQEGEGRVLNKVSMAVYEHCKDHITKNLLSPAAVLRHTLTCSYGLSWNRWGSYVRERQRNWKK